MGGNNLAVSLGLWTINYTPMGGNNLVGLSWLWTTAAGGMKAVVLAMESRSSTPPSHRGKIGVFLRVLWQANRRVFCVCPGKQIEKED
jgi:hypothetical protein